VASAYIASNGNLLQVAEAPTAAAQIQSGIEDTKVDTDEECMTKWFAELKAKKLEREVHYHHSRPRSPFSILLYSA
jgi:hypothetical protein